MAICPYCEEEIDSFVYYSKVEAQQYYYGDKEYSAIEDLGEHTEEEYCCPECRRIIATSEKDADKFLK